MSFALYKNISDIIELTNGEISSRNDKQVMVALNNIKEIYSSFNHKDKFLFINSLSKRTDEESRLLLSVLKPVMLDESYLNLLEELTPYLNKRNEITQEDKKIPYYLSAESYRNFVKQKVDTLPLETIEALQKRAMESFKTGKGLSEEITMNHVLALASILSEVKDRLVEEQKALEEKMLDKELQENLL